MQTLARTQTIKAATCKLRDVFQRREHRIGAHFFAASSSNPPPFTRRLRASTFAAHPHLRIGLEIFIHHIPWVVRTGGARTINYDRTRTSGSSLSSTMCKVGPVHSPARRGYRNITGVGRPRRRPYNLTSTSVYDPSAPRPRERRSVKTSK